MAFIEPMHRNKLNITYLLTWSTLVQVALLPAQHQAFTWANDHKLSIEPKGTNFSEIWIRIVIFSVTKNSFENVHVKWQLFCSGAHVTNDFPP